MPKRKPIRHSRGECCRRQTAIGSFVARLIPAPPTRKAHDAMILTQHSSPRPRRLRAALIGLGLDSGDDDNRLTRGNQTLILRGSAETHAELHASALKIDKERKRRGQELAKLDPAAL